VSYPSDAQLDELEAFLFEHMENDGSMPLDATHGFFTALVSGPRMILPGEWLPQVLGDLEFANMEESQAITATIMQLYNGTIEELDGGRYEPILLTLDSDQEDPLLLPYGWCEGFLIGWNFHGEEVLDTMVADEEAAALLVPVLSFLMYEEEQLMNPPDRRSHHEAAAELGPSAIGLYRWWLPRREMPPMGTA